MIIRLIIAMGILYLAYRAARYIFRQPSGSSRNFPRPRAEIGSEDLVRDPECGTYVPVSSAVEASIDGEKLHFCSEGCRDRYRQSRSRKH